MRMSILTISRQTFRFISTLNRNVNQMTPASCLCLKRYSSNGSVNISSVNNGFAWLRMNKKPVNTMGEELLVDLEDAFSKLENDSQCRGVILTSSIPGVFSAGLDISVLGSNQATEFDKMWTALQNLWLRVYCSPLAIIAAINGNAPAGGCMISIACDHRIMAQGKYHIGISAPRFTGKYIGLYGGSYQKGIPTPAWVQRAMQNTIGQRQAENMLSKGVLCSVEEALNICLIDKVVEQETLEEAAVEEMTKMLKIPDHARVLSKQLLRLKDVQSLRDNQANDLEYSRNIVMMKETQKQIKSFLDNLKQQKK